MKLLGGTLAVLILAASPCAAQGHHDGPGAWIPKNEKYVNKNGTHCCGVNHCRPPEPGSVMRLPGGWIHIPTMTILENGAVGIYPSEEAQPFACVWDDKLQCFFEATGG